MLKRLLPCLFLFLLCFSGGSVALDFEKLFMPGDVISGHKKFEQDCQQCHVRLRETTQKQLCLDCHEDIATDVSQREGFHGRSEKAFQADCRECHTEHKGAEATIVWMDKDSFDHQSTDYVLEGKHLQAECGSCHKSEDKFRDAPSVCVECHQEDDVHDNKLGDQCESCHNPKGWSSEQFDHDKTDFKLQHAHREVACDLCHVESSYKDTPKQCVACHAIKDIHSNRFGNQCQDCHNQKTWGETHFDHERDTSFELKEGHRRVDCHSCHAADYKPKGKQQVARSCYSCHRLDDVHKGQNGKECKQCHNEKTWRTSSFDHDRETEFPLKGAHKKTSCQACHQNTSVESKTDKACYSCHQHKDAHETQLGKNCDQCHNASSWWLEDVHFDHDLSDFPLIGQHAVLGCEACHLSSTFKDTGTRCQDCHQGDDIHKQALGEDCEQCHNPNDWLIWAFDHDTTDFKIRGAHEEIHCHSCHFKPLDKEKQQPAQCNDCHNRDDVHNGNFGANCGRCHSQQDFKTINLQSIRQIGR